MSDPQLNESASTHEAHRTAGGRPDRFTSVPWAAVAVFVAVSFGLAWLVCLPLWLTGGPESPLLAPLIAVFGAIMMFTPAIATLVTMFIMKTPRTERMRLLGMWPLRPAKRVVWFIIGGWLIPPLIVVLVIAAAALLGLVQLDLVTFSGYQALIDAQLSTATDLDSSTQSAIAAGMPPIGVLIAVQVLIIPLGAILNSFFAFGEEIGWRGWLLPALRPLGLWPALVLHGALWGLWHSPLILLGYNFGYLDWRGVALMTGGCIAWGMLFGWSRLRSGSVWPAVIGHGALNAAAGVIVLVASAATEPNMALVGPLGMVAWAIIALLVIVLVLTGQFRREPELAPARVKETS
jgi:membrane protease YdiL (CAAX protease family)